MAKKKTAAPKNGAEGSGMAMPSDGQKSLVRPLPPTTIDDIRGKVNIQFTRFTIISEEHLTPAQRRRKIGAGIRNYGFVEKVADLAAANEDYAKFFDPVDLRAAIANIDLCRDLLLSLQAFVRAVSNTMLVYSDDAFNMSLIFYNMVKEMSRRGDPIATELFRTLQPFFRKQRHAKAEPTAKELERDVHALLSGKKDGEIVIRSEAPKTRGGVREVVDNVRSGRKAAKASVEEEVDEGTGRKK